MLRALGVSMRQEALVQCCLIPAQDISIPARPVVTGTEETLDLSALEREVAADALAGILLACGMPMAPGTDH